VSRPKKTRVIGFGRFIKEKRILCGMSQYAIATSLGVTVRSVRYWECDSKVPSVVHRQRLEEFLQFTLPDSIQATRLLRGLPVQAQPCFTDLNKDEDNG
jgi:transcriptional regulator with XRE-family HTH domain